MNRLHPHRIGLLPAAILLLAFQSTAHAHMAVEGAGQIGNGALHPLMTPLHVMILLGLGLLVGQRVPFDLKRPMQVFAPASAIALILTTTGKIPNIHPPLLIGIALCITIPLALEWKLPPFLMRLLCAAAAIGIGLDSAVESGTTLTVAKTLLGTWLSMNAVATYIAICASNGAKKQWAKIGIRVIGSWIIAISLLALAFSLRK